MPLNELTVFKKSVEELRKGFKVTKDTNCEFAFQYGEVEIYLYCFKEDGKYVNHIQFCSQRFEHALIPDSAWVLDGGYHKNKKAMSLFVESVYDNVYGGCNSDDVEADLLKIGFRQTLRKS